jgi:murein DD-endopeptidase MepM/ murein hydrolase activator NlpD
MFKRICIFLCINFILTTFAAAQSADIKYAVIPETPRPGEPVTISAAGGAKQAVLLANGRQLSKAAFFSVPAADGKPGFITALLTVPSTANPSAAVIRLENDGRVILEIPITIAEREFISEVIELNQVLTGIRTDPDPQKTAESDRLWAILNRTGNEIYYSGKFIPPVSSTRRTSFFGDRRVYKYSNGKSDTSIHAGVDFGVPTGTQVLACGSGKVVLARMRIVTGNSVIIEHAPGVYSLYYHLDKIEVKEDSLVTIGALLGLSGSTGLSTGPHLHWEVRVSTENTDPDAFTARPVIDKDLIISKIYN